MQELTPPVNRHITGKLPTHSSSVKLASNFKDLDKNALLFILNKAGYMSVEGKPTKAAAEAGLIDRCEKSALWNLEKVSETLTALGQHTERAYVNQELPEYASMEPIWVNLGTLGTYFNATAKTVGKWLDDLGLKDDEGMASGEALDQGLASVMEMNAGGKKTRSINHWNLRLMQEKLMAAGHPLDFDYEKNLKGTGRNSDVEVTSIDGRAREFAKEFLKLFKDPATRTQSIDLVRKNPTLIVKKAEVLMKRPGFISSGEYLKHMKRQ